MDKKNMEKIKKEWNEEEIYSSAKSINTLAYKLKGQSLSSMDFEETLKSIFPKFNSNGPIGVWRPSIGNVVSLFPFYRPIIVPLYPIKKEEESLGLSIPQIIELYRNGFVLPVFDGDMELYFSPEVFDIFEPLLKLRGQNHVLSIGRFWLFYFWWRLSLQDSPSVDLLVETEEIRIIGSDEIDKIIDKLEKEAETQIIERYGTKRKIENKILQAYDSCSTQKVPEVLGWTISACKYAYLDFVKTVSVLKLFGFDKVIEVIFKKVDDVSCAYIFLSSFYELYCDPLFWSFGGYMNYGYKEYKRLIERGKKLIKGLPESYLSKNKAIVLPQDFLMELKHQLLYKLPVSVDDPLRFAYNLREYDCIETHYKILKKINDDFNEGKFRDALGRIKDIKEVMHEINAKVGEIERSSKRVKNIIKIGSILIPSTSLPLGIQALTRGDLTSFFAWAGIWATNILMGKYDEESSKLFTGLRFKKTGTPYLLWQHEKKR